MDDSITETEETVTITHSVSTTVDTTNYPTSLTVDSVSVTVTDNDAKPGVPSDVIAAHEGPDKIHVGWDAPANDGGSAVMGYKVEVSTDNSTWTTLTSNTTDTHYTHSSLSEGDTRYYRVSATNANGTGNASSAVNATTAGVNVALYAPTISSPTCDGGTTVPIVYNVNNLQDVNTLQDIVISMEWQIEGVVGERGVVLGKAPERQLPEYR